MIHAPGAGSIARPVDQQFSVQLLYHESPPPLLLSVPPIYIFKYVWYMYRTENALRVIALSRINP